MQKIKHIVFLMMLGSSLAAQQVNVFNKIYSIFPMIPANASSIMLSNNGYIIYSETADSVYPYSDRVAIQKIDTLGNLVWSKSYGKMGLQYWATYEDGGGGVSVPWGGYAGTGWITNDSDTWSDAALFRFDSKGDTVWTKRYNDSAQIECTKLKVTRDKKYIIGGFWVGQSNYTVTLMTTDSLGNKLWQKNYNAGLSCVIGGIDTTKDGGFIIAIDEDYSPNANKIYIIKADSLGNVQWIKTLSDSISGCSIGGYGIISLNNGEYEVAGYYETSNSNPYYPTLYICKLSGTGNVLWAREYNYPASPLGSSLFMLRELYNADVIATGYEYDDSSNCWGIVMKIDSNGNQQWLRRYSILLSEEHDCLNDIRPTPDGGYVACGFTYPITNSVTENIWVIKTDSLGCDTTDCNYATGVGELRTKSEEVRVYPNPNNGSFTLSLSNIHENYNVEIYNVLGEKVYSQLSTFNSPLSINLSNQPNGVYLYRVSTETGALVGEGKLVIEK